MTVHVIFIGGLGRSGSTLLDLMLGMRAGACSVGELTHLWTRGVAHGERCGCGETFHECPFWTAVGARAFGGWDGRGARRAAGLRHGVDRNRYIPLMLAPWLSRRYRQGLDEYARALGTLYEAIAAEHGAGVVVDSSKHASTAFLLRHVPGIDVHVVHLIRDPRGVGYSWSKLVRKPEVAHGVALMDRVSSVRIALRWLLYNALFHGLSRLGTSTSRLRYEDFVEDPDGHLTGILAEAGITATADAQVTRLERIHTVAGNPLRFRVGDLHVRGDEAWRTHLRPRDRRVISTITWLLARRYGYLRGAENGAASPVAAPSPKELTPSSSQPSVSVIIPTHDRPALLRSAVDAAVGQDYDGIVEVVVVHDQSEPDLSLAHSSPHRRVRVITNDRRAGLAGARNAGVDAASGTFVAFCDDDDRFLPGKLRAQVEALTTSSRDVAIGSVRIQLDGRSVGHRRPPGDEVTLQDLVRARVTAAHPSTVMVRRSAFWVDIGPVDEDIPGSYAEDYEWLLRAAAHAPILAVPTAVTEVRWGSGSLFSNRWATICDAIDYLIDQHPELGGDRLGLARLYGRKAFAHAALGQRRAARTWARRSWALNHGERRAYVAMLASSGAVRAETLLRVAHTRGRGI